MASVAERLNDLFAGLQRSHGQYVVPADAVPDAKGKTLGRALTVSEPLTPELWRRHLAGERSFGLGVSPIREDATCSFAAIDVDVYPLDLPDLDRRQRAFGMPLVTCRTKSGGAHLYLFLRAPCPAELVRAKMVEWAALLGYPGVEVFPKQTRLPTVEDHGNWINMPYQGGARTTRYAYGESGQALTAEEFLDLAEKRKVDEDWLRSYRAPAPEGAAEDYLEGAPPCLEVLAARGFGDWQNNGMFNVAVYLRKRFGDGWQELASDYNETLMAPHPLDAKDLAGVVRSVTKKSYSYKCKDEPVCGVCNKDVCKTRDFGVGGGANSPGDFVFGDLVKLMTDPPVWIWEVNGAKVELSSEEMLNQSLFNRKVMEKINALPNLMKGPKWQQLVKSALDNVVEVDVPRDATKEGQWMHHLQTFCTGRAKARSLDEIMMGKPFPDPATGRTAFRSSDFIAYLSQHRVTGASERTLYAWLKREGVQNHHTKLKGKGVTYWSVASFEEQKQEFEVPRAEAEEM